MKQLQTCNIISIHKRKKKKGSSQWNNIKKQKKFFSKVNE